MYGFQSRLRSNPSKRVSSESRLNRMMWSVNLDSQVTLPCKIDTGADCSCISYDTYKDYVKKGLENSETAISGISAPTVRPVGKVHLKVSYGGKSYTLLCEVVDHKIPNLIGLDDSLMMNLISRVDQVHKVGDVKRDRLFSKVKCQAPESVQILREYKNVFQGLGKIPGEIILNLNPDAVPVAHPPRPVPEALREPVKAKLDQMEREGIIEKIPLGTPTPWCAAMHTVLKKSKQGGPITADEVRITIDPKDLIKPSGMSITPSTQWSR